MDWEREKEKKALDFYLGAVKNVVNAADEW
jgi:hypothetical protein